MPLAIVAETDDRVLRLPYVWHGPVIDLPWSPIKLQFRGRPLPEWVMLAAALVVYWQAVDVALAVADAVTGGSLGGGAQWAITHSAAAWTLSSQTAGFVWRRAVNSDRSVAYLAVTVKGELGRWLWSHGPIDRAVVAAGFLPWWAVNRALGAVPLPRPALWVIAAVVVCWPARRLVAAFEPPERALAHKIARAQRRHPATVIIAEGALHAA